MTDTELRSYRRKHRNRAIGALMAAHSGMSKESAERWIDVVRAYDDVGRSRNNFITNHAPPLLGEKAWDVYQQTKNKLSAVLA